MKKGEATQIDVPRSKVQPYTCCILSGHCVSCAQAQQKRLISENHDGENREKYGNGVVGVRITGDSLLSSCFRTSRVTPEKPASATKVPRAMR